MKLDGMEVKTFISRQTVHLILILTAGGSTVCIRVPERYGGEGIPLFS